MPSADQSKSFYFFDIDDNLLFLPTKLYLWNAETQSELAISSREFANVQTQLGRPGKWQALAVREETFRDFRDRADVAPRDQSFVVDLRTAIAQKTPWQGPSWPLLVHAATRKRPIAIVTARGHDPTTIEAAFDELVSQGLLPRLPQIIGIYAVTNNSVRAALGATDPNMTVPSVKKMAIRNAVDRALKMYGAEPAHRFGMSDDDPSNVVLAISAMRDCKEKYPGKRFFVINTNDLEFVKLEIFPMSHPVTATATPSGAGVLQEVQCAVTPALSAGGNVSVYVSDMDRAVEFYSDKLGFKLKTRIAGEWAEVDAGNGLVIGLHPARPPETVNPGTIGAINIELAVSEPLEKVVDALAKRGVEFKGKILDYPNVRLVSAKDPDNNVILLAQVLNA